ncbi:hypothetical protein IGI04_008120 [Brassica rapa subsp. trilocularis]|uniref:Uncharacterized protein n=1 Tax=Brassica rapa subsp. trilocularis TaxID=1813537 RepID=A0ABQ7NNT2_BRACM|nr:hypothetical protein IGI04_008120 [Brassica rapa subsp. trilocularis]
MTSHFWEHASTVLVVIYYRFVEEDHRASTHHMLKQRVMRMVSGMLSLWVVTVLSGHMVIVLAEEAWQELMCKSMILTLTPLITSFLKMSASGYHKSSRSYIHDSGCSTNASDNVYCTLLARSVVHGEMAGYTGYTSGLINGKPTNIPYNWNYLVRHKRTVVLRDGPDLIFFVVAEDSRETEQCGDYMIECGQG